MNAYPTGIEIIVALTNPASYIEGMTITAVSGNPFIATIEERAIVNEDGTATFNATGELPGMALITFELDGTRISEVVEIRATNEALKVEDNDDDSKGEDKDDDGGSGSNDNDDNDNNNDNDASDTETPNGNGNVNGGNNSENASQENPVGTLLEIDVDAKKNDDLNDLVKTKINDENDGAEEDDFGVNVSERNSSEGNPSTGMDARLTALILPASAALAFKTRRKTMKK